MLDTLIIATAAFFAGILNAMAGGGSFLTLSALIYIGIPPVIANATSAVAVFPGYLSSSFAFRDEIKTVTTATLYQLVIASIIGGLTGSLLLLVTPNQTFRIIIPWLLLFATIIFAFGKPLAKRISPVHTKANHQSIISLRSVVIFVVCVYGGYFNGGLGIILLALFSFMGLKQINQMNGLKNYLSAILSSVSVLTFVIAGIVYWKGAIVMMVAAGIGGFIGARLSRRLHETFIRGLVVITGFIMTVLFFLNK